MGVKKGEYPKNGDTFENACTDCKLLRKMNFKSIKHPRVDVYLCNNTIKLRYGNSITRTRQYTRDKLNAYLLSNDDSHDDLIDVAAGFARKLRKNRELSSPMTLTRTTYMIDSIDRTEMIIKLQRAAKILDNSMSNETCDYVDSVLSDAIKLLEDANNGN